MNKSSDKLLSKLFFTMLPVQIMIFAMGSINTIVDGAMAGRFIDATAVGVIGLYYSMVNILNAVSSVVLGGTTVLCGKYMGRGEIDKTEGVFSLNITVTFIVGIIITALSAVIPGPIAALLGASEELKGYLSQYIVGYAIGILPMLFAQQLASFLQMERQNGIGFAGVGGMIVSNVILDVVLVGVLKMGIWGLALATSLSNLTYFIILVPYFFTSKAQLHYGISKSRWQDFGKMISIGMPGALLVFCLAVRGMVINRILLKYAGNDGLAAQAAFNMVLGLLIAYCLGNGSVVRMLISVFVGEEDKGAMKKVLRIVFTKGLLASAGLSVILLFACSYITTLFFPDKSTNVYKLTHELFIIYSLCIPLILICQIFTNYLQALGHDTIVRIQSVFDGFISMVIPALILAPILGAMGVWLSNPIGIVMTILLVPIYDIIYWKRIPHNIEEWMLLDPSFGTASEDLIDISVTDKEVVSETSEKIQAFCQKHGMGKRKALYAALCLEEIAVYIIDHGFKADKKSHSINSICMFKDDKVVLRIKDDCIPFDPKDMAELTTESENADNLGIRAVYKIADDVNYQNMLGLNVLTITIAEKNLLENEDNDFLLERRLKELNPDLSAKFRNTVFSSQTILSKYKLIFPEYTDHSELHSMTVIDSCNRLIGKKQMEKLNEDEIFVLLVACYLHDIGMGIQEKDFEDFKNKLPHDGVNDKKQNMSMTDFVREYHNEFSGLFVEKYADFFELPSPGHVFAVKQIVRGHRKTDLYDDKEYPSDYKLPNGNTVCLKYLSALIRLADEIDVVATRNPLVLYDIDTLTNEIEIVENKKLQAVKRMMMTEDAFILYYKTDDAAIEEAIKEMAGKMQKTLDYCRDVVGSKTPFTINQSKVVIRRI